VRLEAYKLSFDVGPMVVDVIKDQNPARRQQVARDIGLLVEISGVVIAVHDREVEAAVPKSAKIGERVLTGSLGVVGFERVVLADSGRQ
jgi:hypothetical protein